MTGETANDAIDGFACSWCGTYFENPHGYPVLCGPCWRDDAKRAEDKGLPRAGLPRATEKELG